MWKNEAQRFFLSMMINLNTFFFFSWFPLRLHTKTDLEMCQVLLLTGDVGGQDQRADLVLQRLSQTWYGRQVVQDAAFHQAAHGRTPVVVLEDRCVLYGQRNLGKYLFIIILRCVNLKSFDKSMIKLLVLKLDQEVSSLVFNITKVSSPAGH